jgi:DNA-binding NarL/FixJ family response regulator
MDEPIDKDAARDQTIEVLIIDDHAMMADGIASILDHAPGMRVVGQATSGQEGLAKARRLAPDVAIIDVAMPGLNGMEAARKIHAADPAIAMLAVSMHADERYVNGMLDAGARGYVLKTCNASELLEAIASVHRGRYHITSELTHVLVERSRAGHNDSRRAACATLTPREREVLQLLAEGLSSKEIAAKLGLVLKTVDTHRTNIIRKLDLHSIAELTKYAIREGLTGLA